RPARGLVWSPSASNVCRSGCQNFGHLHPRPVPGLLGWKRTVRVRLQQQTCRALEHAPAATHCRAWPRAAWTKRPPTPGRSQRDLLGGCSARGVGLGGAATSSSRVPASCERHGGVFVGGALCAAAFVDALAFGESSSE